MLDIKFIRENTELVATKAKQKGYDANIKQLLELDEKRRKWVDEVESLRAKRNQLTEAAKGTKPSPEQIAEGKKIKEELAKLEARAENQQFEQLLREIPNVFSDDTPIGGEDDSRELKKWGEPSETKIKDHQSWAEEKGYIDFERGAKVAGHKFYFLKSKLVELELGLLQFALQQVIAAGYYPLTVPHLVNTKTLEGAGFSARGKEKQIYKVEDEDLNLIATAEIPLTGFFADEIIPTEWLPSKMSAWSPSYRVEGGAYGKYNRGLFRVHQFNKLELYVYSQPNGSEAQHQKLLEIEEQICQALEIPYRVVQIASGDLGAPAYKKYDIEYWSPAEKSYRELMSCSNCTDYQARRLNIRFKNEDGATEFVHTLNATALATSRMMIAIIENHQDAKGQVKIPKALQPFMQGQTEI